MDGPGPVLRHGRRQLRIEDGYGGASELYAFDKTTGDELWFGSLGAKSNANPMTYRGKSGRQCVVVAAGLGEGNRLVAFALPRK